MKRYGIPRRKLPLIRKFGPVEVLDGTFVCKRDFTWRGGLSVQFPLIWVLGKQQAHHISNLYQMPFWTRSERGRVARFSRGNGSEVGYFALGFCSVDGSSPTCCGGGWFVLRNMCLSAAQPDAPVSVPLQVCLFFLTCK